MPSITTYVQESVAELRHVRWPTRRQAVRLSGIVILFVAVSAVFFGLVDFGLSQVFKALLNLAV